MKFELKQETEISFFPSPSISPLVNTVGYGAVAKSTCAANEIFPPELVFLNTEKTFNPKFISTRSGLLSLLISVFMIPL